MKKQIEIENAVQDLLMWVKIGILTAIVAITSLGPTPMRSTRLRGNAWARFKHRYEHDLQFQYKMDRVLLWATSLPLAVILVTCAYQVFLNVIL